MSKAFTKDDADAPLFVAPRAPLPPGVTNYVTASGLRALRDELAGLGVERAALDATEPGPDRVSGVAAPGERIAKRTLLMERVAKRTLLMERLAALEDRLASAQLVEAAGDADLVRFGATVVVRGEDGRERRYRIVGVDEADAGRGLVAFVAPIARALLGKRRGDTAVLRTPRGDEELEIVSIAYEGDERGLGTRGGAVRAPTPGSGRRG